MPIDVPSGPGGADRGKPLVSGAPCYLCEVVGGRADKSIVEETDLTLTLVNWAQFEVGQVYVISRRHAPTLFDLTEVEAEAVVHAVRRVAAALLRAYVIVSLEREHEIAGHIRRHIQTIRGPER